MAHLQAAPSINDVRTRAHLALIERLGALDLSPMLVYRIDSAPAGALPLLGWQFDLLSPLWQLLAPLDPSLSISGEATAARRALIKTGIALHRLRGTPAAITAVVSSLGWPGASLLEGQASWGGASWPASQGWAVCRLMVPIPPAAGSAAPAPWSAAITYAQGARVSYEGGTFWATGAPAPDVPPQFASVDDVPDIDTIADWDNLVSAGWALMANLASPVRPVGPADAALIAAAFNFFKPARCWLDSVWFEPPPVADAAPAPADQLEIGGVAAYGRDGAPAPAEGALAMTLDLGAYPDGYGPISPLYNAHYYYHGLTYGAPEPDVADSILAIDGVTHGESL